MPYVIRTEPDVCVEPAPGPHAPNRAARQVARTAGGTWRPRELDVTESGFDRNARLEGQIRAVLAEVLHSDIKDPRLEGVTVSAVKLSADRSHAKVYFSVIGDEEQARHAADAFAAAASFLRRQLGHRMRLRTVPSLELARDTSYEYGDRMERLFDRMHAEGLLDEDEGEGGEER